ncbi:hypothetical protein QUC31_012379 [Theobroma cacao]
MPDDVKPRIQLLLVPQSSYLKEISNMTQQILLIPSFNLALNLILLNHQTVTLPNDPILKVEGNLRNH